MTSLSTIQVKAVVAIIEAIDQDDAKDTAAAVEMIRTLLEAGEKKA